MPYYVHTIGASSPENDHRIQCPTAGEAYNAKEPGETVTFVASYEERCAWVKRERNRFKSGEYLPVPWTVPGARGGFRHGEHFAHLSIKRPGMVAYTKNQEHGVQDRQTVTRPGRYLEEFYADRFTQAEIAEFVSACLATTHPGYSVARTPLDIVRVYEGGPKSCMGTDEDGNAHRFDFGHPCQVYGNSDLALAYTGPIEQATSRAIIWPACRRHSRVYGPRADVLVALLRADGYEQGSMHGARVRAVWQDDYLLMPYVDGISCAEHAGQGWIRLGNGPIETDETRGYVIDESDEDDGETYSCEHCEARYRYEDEGTPDHCQACADVLETCSECDEPVWTERRPGHSADDYARLSDGHVLCNNCANRATATCRACEGTWIERQLDGPEQRERAHNHLTAYCSTCADDRQYCELCDKGFETAEHTTCPDCKLTAARCDHTMPLPLLDCEAPIAI